VSCEFLRCVRCEFLRCVRSEFLTSVNNEEPVSSLPPPWWKAGDGAVGSSEILVIICQTTRSRVLEDPIRFWEILFVWNTFYQKPLLITSRCKVQDNGPTDCGAFGPGVTHLLSLVLHLSLHVTVITARETLLTWETDS
jgi:hypothetical protein